MDFLKNRQKVVIQLSAAESCDKNSAMLVEALDSIENTPLLRVRIPESSDLSLPILTAILNTASSRANNGTQTILQVGERLAEHLQTWPIDAFIKLEVIHGS